MTQQQSLICLAGVVVLSLIAAPYLARGEARQRQAIEANRQAIAGMTRLERDRLEQRYTSFQSLSSDDQNQLRALHEELQQDQARQGELTQLLNDFGNWLKTIEPYQRERLLAAKEQPSEARLELVREIVKEQQASSAERALQRSGSSQMRLGGFNSRYGPPMFDAATLARVMEEIERRAKTQLQPSAEQLAEIESRSGVERSLHVLRLLSRVNPRASLIDDPPQALRDVAADIDQFVEDSRIRDFISSGETPRIQGARLARQLHFPLQIQYYRQLRAAQSRPTRTDLKNFLAGLDEREQQALLEVDAANFETDLRSQYVNPDAPGSLEPDQVRRELAEMFASNENMPFGGFRGRSPGDDGRGGGFRNRSTRERRPGDRRDGGFEPPEFEPGGPPLRLGPEGNPRGDFRGRDGEPAPPRGFPEPGQREFGPPGFGPPGSGPPRGGRPPAGPARTDDEAGRNGVRAGEPPPAETPPPQPASPDAPPAAETDDS